MELPGVLVPSAAQAPVVCRGSYAHSTGAVPSSGSHTPCALHSPVLWAGESAHVSGWVQHPHLEGFALRSASRLQACQDVTALLCCFTQLNAAWWHFAISHEENIFLVIKNHIIWSMITQKLFQK